MVAVAIKTPKMSSAGGTKKMSALAFVGGMIVAIIIDLVGIIVPILGTVFIAFMRLSFWLVGYDMRNTTTTVVTTAILEMLPIIPTCIVFMARTYGINKKNIIEREKNAKESGIMLA